MHKYLLAALLFLLTSCASIPEGVTPVQGFEVNRFLGKWYEVARLNHSFERGLSNVTATYSLKQDGTIRVINRGYKERNQRWSVAEGKAKFVADPMTGRLKVSFFGPIYGGYNIIELDKQGYQYALIVGNDRSTLWILSRTPKLDPVIQARLVQKARDLKFPVDGLIYVAQGTRN
ncbi:MAG: lipocalin family protein [Leucothrix sp.]